MHVDLDAIRERARATIPGPWRWFADHATPTLATDHSGRITILDPRVHADERVHHHWQSEDYSLAEARRLVADWFPPGTPLHDRARAFLAENLDPIDPYARDVRDLVDDDNVVALSRYVRHQPDLYLPARDADGQLNGLVASWRAQGIHTPEAAFIAHARQDVEDLLDEIDRLGGDRAPLPDPTPTPAVAVALPEPPPPSGGRPPAEPTGDRVPGAAAARARSTSAWPAPPPITESVRTRRVIFRGTKDDVARHLALLHPLSADQVDAGFERYVEFTASAASSKRWRIVVVSPAWTPERVAETPSEEPGADSLRALNTMHVVTQPTGVAA